MVAGVRRIATEVGAAATVLPGPRATAATRGVGAVADRTSAAVAATHLVAAGRTSVAEAAVTLAVVVEVIREAEATRVAVGDITDRQLC